ncbi:MAG: acyl-CoA synthetase [Burkholderiaceae bacterium]
MTPTAAAWASDDERGSRFALRLMAFIATTLGRPVARLVLHGIAAYFVLFAPQARRHSKRYLTRALGRPATLADVYRHVHAFASTVLDRVYLARGQLELFDLHVEGGALMDELVAGGRGAVLLGAHLGSFEALHAMGASRPGMRVAMAMFPRNARMIHGILKAVAPQAHLDVIEIGRPETTLAVKDWLDGGGLVGMLGDRHLHDDGARTGLVAVPFLGREALFSEGPLRLAMILRRPVIFMVGLYRGGRRYDVRFEPLADFSTPIRDAAERERRLREALRGYVQRLEALCREAPENWFNFFDFWHEDQAT